jgi:hypothetical protein
MRCRWLNRSLPTSQRRHPTYCQPIFVTFMDWRGYYTTILDSILVGHSFLWLFNSIFFATASYFDDVYRYLGPCIYIITGTTILLGIQEKEGFIGCSYQVTTPDYNPLVHYFDIPLACRISHGLGLVVLLMMISTTFALYQPYQFEGQRSRIK